MCTLDIFGLIQIMCTSFNEEKDHIKTDEKYFYDWGIENELTSESRPNFLNNSSFSNLLLWSGTTLGIVVIGIGYVYPHTKNQEIDNNLAIISPLWDPGSSMVTCIWWSECPNVDL